MKSSNKQYGKRLLILAFPIIMNNIIAQLQMIIDRKIGIILLYFNIAPAYSPISSRFLAPTL